MTIKYNLRDVTEQDAKAKGKVFYKAWKSFYIRQLFKNAVKSCKES